MLQANKKIKDYIDSVCREIKWKKSHSYIANELENHIIDQQDAFMKEGLNENTALESAIKEMGDPIDVGSELDRIHKPKVEWSIIGLASILLLLGLIIQTMVIGGAETNIGRIVIYSGLGIVAMIAAYLSDYTIIGKYPNRLFFGFLAIVLGVSIISPQVRGQTFYTKFVLLLYPTIFAGIIYSMRDKGYLGIVLCGVFMVISYIAFLPFALASTYFLYSLLSLVLLTVAILKGWFNVNKAKGMLLIYIPTVMGVLVLLPAIFRSSPYILDRFTHAFNPSLDPLGHGWMSGLTRDIISNAKFIGEGLGSSSGYMVPAINTDFLLTYLVHRFGWIAFIFIVSILTLLIIKSFRLCLKQDSILGSLVSLSVVLTISAQILMYIGYNLGFQLIAPLTLPLVSYGGMGTIINMLLIGIMLSVFKWGNLVKDSVLLSSNKKFLTMSDGKIIIDFKS